MTNFFLTISEFDLLINETIARSRTPFQDLFFGFFTQVGHWFVIFILLVIFVAIFLSRNRVYPVIVGGVCVLGAGATTVILKSVISRPRPDPSLALRVEDFASMPSGHATLVMALFISVIYFCLKSSLTILNKIVVVALSVLIILLVGYSRLYLGVHYLSDVLAGYLVVLIWLGLAVWFAESAKKRASSQ